MTRRVSTLAATQLFSGAVIAVVTVLGWGNRDLLANTASVATAFVLFGAGHYTIMLDSYQRRVKRLEAQLVASSARAALLLAAADRADADGSSSVRTSTVRAVLAPAPVPDDRKTSR